MADMRAQMLLSVRDKLLGPLKRNRRALAGVSREFRKMRGAADGVGRSTSRVGRAQARMAQDTRRANRTLQQQERILKRLERRHKHVRDRTMMKGAGIAAAGAASVIAGRRVIRGAVSPAKQYGSFDEQADAVAAIARVKAGGRDDKMLRANARQLGANTSYTAMEASQGQEYLAMAGFDPKAIVNSMGSVLDLAKAGRVEIGRAADISSDIGSGFGIEKTEAGMGRLADVLIGTSTRANTSVEMLGETMKYAAPYAKQFGASLETTSAMAGVMADSGVKGSQAGTAMSATFARLASPPKEAAKALKKLGVTTRDASGNMLPILDILSDINAKTRNLASGDRLELLTDIAGLEAGKGFLSLVDDAGLARVKELVAELKKAKGEASRVSKAMGDNLIGDGKTANSATAELGLVIGKQIEPAMRSLVQLYTRAVRGVTEFARAHPNLVKWLGLAAVGLGALMMVGGALVTILGTAIVSMAAMRFSMAMLGINALRAGSGVAGLRGGLLGLGKMKPMRWGRFIRSIGWAALAGALVWTLLISDISWSDFLSPVKWREWIGALDWGSVITALSIASFIAPFSWVKAIGRLSWSALITPLKWGVRFIPVIGWAALAGTLAWHLLIKPLGWDKYLNFDALKSAWNGIEGWLDKKIDKLRQFLGLGRQLRDGDAGHVATRDGAAGRRDSRRARREGKTINVDDNLPPVRKDVADAKPQVSPSKPKLSGAAARKASRKSRASVPAVAQTKVVERKVTVPTFRPGVEKEARAATKAVLATKKAATQIPNAVRQSTAQAEGVLRAINWTSHGERMMSTLAQGVRNGGALVKQAIAAELAQARALLPSSNAKEGPLSNLTGNGRAILATMASGINGDGGLASKIGGALHGAIPNAAPLLPQLSAAGVSVGQIAGAAPTANGQQSQSSGGNTFGNIIFNIYPQSAEDGANQIEAKMRAIMHGKLND